MAGRGELDLQGVPATGGEQRDLARAASPRRGAARPCRRRRRSRRSAGTSTIRTGDPSQPRDRVIPSRSDPHSCAICLVERRFSSSTTGSTVIGATPSRANTRCASSRNTYSRPCSGSRRQRISGGHHSSPKSCASSTTTVSNSSLGGRDAARRPRCAGSSDSQYALSSSEPVGAPQRIGQVVEEADEGRALRGPPRLRDAHEVAREAARVAEQRDAVALLGAATRLLEREPRLAGAGAADDLEPPERAQGVEEARLVAGELVEVVLVLGGAREGVDLRRERAGEVRDQGLERARVQAGVTDPVLLDRALHQRRRRAPGRRGRRASRGAGRVRPASGRRGCAGGRRGARCGRAPRRGRAGAGGRSGRAGRAGPGAPGRSGARRRPIPATTGRPGG